MRHSLPARARRSPRSPLACRRAFAALTVLVTLCSTPAFAFESVEHQWLANAGVCLAYRAIAAKAPHSAEDLLAALRGFLKYPSTSYGRVVQVPDYVRSTTNLLTFESAELERINWAFINKQSGGVLPLLIETNQNGHHFRLSALQTYNSLHRQAVAMATTDNPSTLWDALAINAYADHFLQDSMAPGHMTVDVGDRSSADALRLHDCNNSSGRFFRIRPEMGAELRAVLTSANVEDPQVWSECFPDSRLEEPHSPASTVAETTCALGDYTRCPTRMDDSAIEPGGLLLFGDHHVVVPTDGSMLIKQPAEALLIALVTARSVLDVTDAYLESKLLRHSGFRTLPSADIVDKAVLFGEQCGDTPDPLAIPVGNRCFGVFRDSSRVAEWNPFRLTENKYYACNVVGCFTAQYRADLHGSCFLPVIGISGGLQRLNNLSRKLVSGEAIYGLPTQSDQVQLQISAGGTYLDSSPSLGYGPDLHLYAMVKDLGVWCSLDVGYRWYAGSGRRANAPVGGMRVGLGTSFVWLFAGWSYDQSLDSSGLQVDPSTFSLGAMATLPPNFAARVWRAFSDRSTNTPHSPQLPLPNLDDLNFNDSQSGRLPRGLGLD